MIHFAPTSSKVYRVAELTRLIKTVLEDEVGEVWVEGELSNFRPSASGHWYFTLKDESAQLALVMFRGSQRGVGFSPRMACFCGPMALSASMRKAATTR